MPARRRFGSLLLCGLRCLPAVPLLAAACAAPHPASAARGSADPRLRLALDCAESIFEGGSGSGLRAFIDLQCPACKRLYRQTRPDLRSGRVRLQWIPVDLLGRDSLLSAVRVLVSAQPTRALAKEMSRGGTRAPPARAGLGLRAQKAAAVHANLALLRLIAGPSPATPQVLLEPPGGASKPLSAWRRPREPPP